MPPLSFRWIAISAVALPAVMAHPASAQTAPDLKARCNQLIAFFDRYGASRSQNSDGARNHTRIGAAIDCGRGDYAKGVATMEALLKQKRFEVPPPPTGPATTR